MSKGRVTGVGGVFFLCDDVGDTKQWYSNHLGLKTDQWGSSFQYRLVDRPEVKGMLQWSPFARDTPHFDTSKQEFMINYTVVNIEDLVSQLRADGVTICDDIVSYDYGKFVHIIDGDGRKVELWEPVDNPFEDDPAVEVTTSA